MSVASRPSSRVKRHGLDSLRSIHLDVSDYVFSVALVAREWKEGTVEEVVRGNGTGFSGSV
jgi:hypothetical protein